MIVLGLALIAVLVFVTHEVKRVRFPRPEPWSSEDELVAMEVARTLGVTIETARLAVLAWRT